MSKIKTFEEYQKESGGSEKKNEMYREVTITKDINEKSSCSTELQEKMWDVCEAACKEMKSFNEDEHDGHTAKEYLKEFMGEMKKITEYMKEESGSY